MDVPASNRTVTPHLTFPRRRALRKALRRNGTAYLFLLPYLFILLTFTLGAAVFGLALSLYHVNYGIDTPRYIGLDNFRYLWDQFLHNRDNFEFAISLRNILQYAVVVIIGQTALALCYALLLNRPVKGRSFLRTAIYLPSVTSSVAITLIFLYLLSNGGALNAFLSIFHIQGPNW